MIEILQKIDHTYVKEYSELLDSSLEGEYTSDAVLYIRCYKCKREAKALCVQSYMV
jgi:hypothetical protein